ncbi:MAG: chromate transporter [Clostridiales bacterium]|nr:chromate transporter [Clostridiales bacterium]
MKNINSAGIKLLLKIFWSTFKMGLVTFGGGLAMISVIHSEFSEKNELVSSEEISDITAVAQSLPGVIAVNSSVMVAYRIGGNSAAILAGIGAILPSVIVLCLVTVFYNFFVDSPYVRGFLRGVSGAVIALFISTLHKLYRKNLADKYAVIFFIIAAALIFIFPSLNVVFLIIGGAAAGFVLYYLVLKKWNSIND